LNLATAYLEQTARSPVGASVKRRASDLLQLWPGARVIDVGSGTGADTVSFATQVGPSGRVVGIDTDPTMLAQATAASQANGVAAWTEHIQGTASALPFPDASFDAWHSERLLQHLPWYQPLLALREAARVLRPGGRAVVVDTDWASLSIAADDPEIERRISRLTASNFANGYVGRQLPRLVRQAGLVRTNVESIAVPLSPGSIDFVLGQVEQTALSTGSLMPLEWHLWRRTLDDFRYTGVAVAHVIMVIVAALRP
jgi:ubiquinone/menaquinone biosynthesis C-methylase UbiE